MSDTVTDDFPLPPADFLASFHTACRSGQVNEVAILRRWLERFPVPQRPDALVDLVSAHLAWSWQTGRGRFLEEYVAEFGKDFTEFASMKSLPADLAETEFIARHEHASSADHPRVIDYTERFPGRDDVAEQLAARCLDDGRYVKIRLQGQGGMGLVWLAYDQHLRRYVALKEPQPRCAESPTLLHRLADEARVTAGLDHPAIVGVHEFRLSDEEQPFYVMRLVQGQTLRHLIREYHGAAGSSRVLLNRLLQTYVTVCEAVAYAHSRGVVHRDLKPDNVKVGEFGETVVLDWGLFKYRTQNVSALAPTALPAPASGQPASTATETQPYIPSLQTPPSRSGSACGGTLGYMPPEQSRGRADERSDIFSLGAILYEILTGQPPYELAEGEKMADLVLRVQQARFPLPHKLRRDVPRALEAVCLTAMAPGAEDRYPTAVAVAEDVKRWLADEEVSCYPDLPRRPLTWLARKARHHPGVAGSVLVVLLLVLTGLPIWYWIEQQQRAQLQARAETVLEQAEGLMAAEQPPRARELLIEVRTQLQGKPQLDALLARVDRALEAAQSAGRFPEFKSTADQADFHILGSLWTLLPHEITRLRRRVPPHGPRGADLATGLELAKKALALYGLTDNPLEAANTPLPGLLDSQQAVVRKRSAEVLFLWALGVERSSQGKGDEAHKKGCRVAVRLLSAAEASGMRAKSLYEHREKFHRHLGDIRAADADGQKARGLKPTTFFDHHFHAAALAQARKWADAATAFNMALAVRPDDYWTLFRLAKAYENQGKLDEAAALFRSCIALRPDDPTGYNNLGTLLHNMDRPTNAVREFEEALRKEPGYVLAYANLILAHAERKDVAAAEEVMQRFLKRFPDQLSEQSHLYGNLGIAYERAGQFEVARRYYSRSLELDENNVRSLRNRSIVLAALRRFDEAKRDIRRATELAPKDGELHYVLGNYHVAQRQYEDAIAAYTRAVELTPRLWNAWYNRGVIRRRLKRYKEAFEDQSQVLTLRPGYLDAHFERALILAISKDYRAAIDDLNAILVRDPTNVSALLTRGKVFGDLGKDYEKSEADLNLAIQLAPKEPDAYRSRGLTRFRMENWAGAIADYQKYLQLSPRARDAAGIHNDISVAFLNMGKVKEALVALQDAEALQVTPSTLSNRGNIYLREGDLGHAVAEFDLAIKIDGRHTRAWALRGQARLRQGQFTQAADDLDQALKLEPGVYETLLFCGLAKLGKGDPAAARRHWEVVVRDRPTHVRGKFAHGMLRLLDKDYVGAVGSLSQAIDDSLLRPFVLPQMARAWLEVGGATNLATGCADELIKALPRDGFAHFQAATIYARAAAGAGAGDAPKLRERARELLKTALGQQPELSERTQTEPALRGIGQES